MIFLTIKELFLKQIALGNFIFSLKFSKWAWNAYFQPRPIRIHLLQKYAHVHVCVFIYRDSPSV
jgi:hypothetical protein